MVRRILSEDLAMRLGSLRGALKADEPGRRLFVAIDEFMASQSGISASMVAGGRLIAPAAGAQSIRSFALTEPVNAGEAPRSPRQ